VQLLKSEGHHVKGIDVNLYDKCDLYEFELPHESLIRDVFEVTPEDLRGYDAVIHLAALSNDPLGEFDPSLTWHVNHAGTMHVAECAKAAGVPRFLFSSSCSIYGKAGDKILAEDDELFPVTAYGETKIASEHDLSAMASDTFSPVYLRNATAYGSSPRLRLDIVLNNLTAWAHATKEIRIISDGTPWRPLIHCRDIARAFIHLAQSPLELVHDQAFNVGRNEENYQVRDLADIVMATIPGSVVTYTGEGSPDSRDYRVDFSKFRRTFPEFSFEHDVRSGAAELDRDYTRYGMTLETIEGPKFVRLRTLRERGAFEMLRGD
jgi:nucleoside-diphosphate-sugar epimerase